MIPRLCEKNANAQVTQSASSAKIPEKPGFHRRFGFALVITAWLGVLISPVASKAYTPEGPAVQKLVNAGIKYLENYDKKIEFDGERILVAYAHFKVEHDDQAPLVRAGVAAAEKIAALASSGRLREHGGNYDAAIAVIFLASINAEKYRSQLETLQQYLFKVQKGNGTFTYNHEDQGDVSQTQYALLAIWTLDRSGIALDYAKVAKTIGWILRVQDPTGGWPYRTVDPGVGKGLVSQKGLSSSMALAGASSVLIAGDALRLWGDTSNDDDPGITGLPKAIKIYKEDANQGRRNRIKLSKEPIFRSIKGMEAWRSKNGFVKTGTLGWFYYYLYTMERYESFVEIANGRPKDSSPAWYNQGVEELMKRQDASGGWVEQSYSQPHVKTSFAILFLIRSTQKAIFTPAAGGSIGGYGIPDNAAKTKLVNGKAVEDRPAQAVSAMLDLLDGEDGEIDVRSMAEAMKLPNDPKARSTQLDRLERMVRGSRQWQARRVAAIVLGKSGEMRSVPSLIYALSDPDKSVRRYARDGLRMISRKFEGFEMSDDPDYAELTKAQDSWRDWYRSMDPGYVFLDTDL